MILKTKSGFACMNAFLELNDIVINFPEDEAVEVMVKVATSDIDLGDLSEWLKGL